MAMGHYQSEASALTVGLLRSLALGLAMALGGQAHAQSLVQVQAVTPVTGTVSIESDVQRADNLTGIVTASGNVRIVYPDRRVVATARQAQYFSREGRVVLSGDVDVIQTEGPSIQADRITYLVEEERLVALPAEGGQVLSRFPIAALSTPSVDPNTP